MTLSSFSDEGWNDISGLSYYSTPFKSSTQPSLSEVDIFNYEDSTQNAETQRHGAVIDRQAQPIFDDSFDNDCGHDASDIMKFENQYLASISTAFI